MPIYCTDNRYNPLQNKSHKEIATITQTRDKRKTNPREDKPVCKDPSCELIPTQTNTVQFGFSFGEPLYKIWHSWVRLGTKYLPVLAPYLKWYIFGIIGAVKSSQMIKPKATSLAHWVELKPVLWMQYPRRSKGLQQTSTLSLGLGKPAAIPADPSANPGLANPGITFLLASATDTN